MVAEPVDPLAKRGEEVWLLSKGCPQNTFPEPLQDFWVVGHRCGERRLADASLPVKSANRQNLPPIRSTEPPKKILRLRGTGYVVRRQSRGLGWDHLRRPDKAEMNSKKVWIAV